MENLKNTPKSDILFFFFATNKFFEKLRKLISIIFDVDLEK